MNENNTFEIIKKYEILRRIHGFVYRGYTQNECVEYAEKLIADVTPDANAFYITDILQITESMHQLQTQLSKFDKSQTNGKKGGAKWVITKNVGNVQKHATKAFAHGLQHLKNCHMVVLWTNSAILFIALCLLQKLTNKPKQSQANPNQTNQNYHKLKSQNTLIWHSPQYHVIIKKCNRLALTCRCLTMCNNYLQKENYAKACQHNSGKKSNY